MPEMHAADARDSRASRREADGGGVVAAVVVVVELVVVVEGLHPGERVLDDGREHLPK